MNVVNVKIYKTSSNDEQDSVLVGEFTAVTKSALDGAALAEMAKQRGFSLVMGQTQRPFLEHPVEEIETTLDRLEEKHFARTRGAEPPDANARIGAVEKSLAMLSRTMVQIAASLEALEKRPPAAVTITAERAVPALLVTPSDDQVDQVAEPPEVDIPAPPHARPRTVDLPRGAPASRAAEIRNPLMSLAGPAPTSSILVYDPAAEKTVESPIPKVGDTLFPLSLKSDI